MAPEDPTNGPKGNPRRPASKPRESLHFPRETAAKPGDQTTQGAAESGTSRRHVKRPNLTLARASQASLPAGAPGSARGSYFTELILSTVNQMESAAKVRESLAFAYWARVVGSQAAAAT